MRTPDNKYVAAKDSVRHALALAVLLPDIASYGDGQARWDGSQFR